MPEAKVLETFELPLGNYSNTCLIDFVVDKKDNILARNYGKTFLIDSTRETIPLDVYTYAERSQV